MTLTKKPKWRIKLAELNFDVVVEARSRHVALRKAFSQLIRDKHIKRQPATDFNFESTFRNVYAQMILDRSHESTNS